MGGLGYYVYSRREDIGKKSGAVQQGFRPGSSEFQSYGATVAQPVMAQPVAAQPVGLRQMQVAVPLGSGPGAGASWSASGWPLHGQLLTRPLAARLLLRP